MGTTAGEWEWSLIKHAAVSEWSWGQKCAICHGWELRNTMHVSGVCVEPGCFHKTSSGGWRPVWYYPSENTSPVQDFSTKNLPVERELSAQSHKVPEVDEKHKQLTCKMEKKKVEVIAKYCWAPLDGKLFWLYPLVFAKVLKCHDYPHFTGLWNKGTERLSCLLSNESGISTQVWPWGTHS